jgi:hypothetical protein
MQWARFLQLRALVIHHLRHIQKRTLLTHQIMKIPIRAKQFPNFLYNAIAKEITLRKKPISKHTTFHLCYFSCESYYPYLYCALHSIKTNIHHPLKIWIFNDEEQQLTSNQIETLRSLIPNMQVVIWPKSMGWGSKQIESIWNAYTLASVEAGPDDIIARIDSDVFFFNDRIFRIVERHSADLIGDGHYVNFGYTQGGCYFFKANAVKKISTWLENQQMHELLNKAKIDVEDIAAFHFAKATDLTSKLTWFMMFPDELRNAGGLSSWHRGKFSCIHFVMKNKKLMLECYEREMLAKSEIPSFLEKLTVK